MIKFNDNHELKEAMLKDIVENKGLCPIYTEKTMDNVCICKKFQEQIDRGEVGHCEFGLLQLVK